jgi:Zn finger protein HypA/HybF involved in hydrogenase expression
MNEKIRELFSSLLRNNTEATSQTFASIMKDKLNDALEIRKVGLTSKIFNKVEVQESVELEEAVEKIACLKCDAVSTAMAWKKNKGFCPVCKTSSQGVAESNELEEATDADLKKVIDTAKKMGGKIN